MESGFGSLSAFNTSFRKMAGMSPSGFRKTYSAHCRHPDFDVVQEAGSPH
jgi:AraC-like DNA-binding protein